MSGPVNGSAGGRVTVVGYASLDRAMAVTTVPGPAGTSLVRRRLSDPWPAPGGIAHLAVEVARAGLDAQAVTWVGGDAGGEGYTAELARRGVGVRGIAVTGARTPTCYLFYSHDGGTVCVYDPGDGRPGGLGAAQREILAGSAWVCLMVSPRAAVLDVLDGLPPAARLAWTVKADPDAFPPEVVRRVLARAAVVTFAAGEERAFLDRAVAPDPLPAAVPGALLVETDGGAAVRYWSGGAGRTRAIEPVAAAGADPTGAGDTFCGGLVASLAAQPDVDTAVGAAIAAAARLLRERSASGEPVRDGASRTGGGPPDDTVYAPRTSEVNEG